MRRLLFTAGLFALVAVTTSMAQDPFKLPDVKLPAGVGGKGGGKTAQPEAKKGGRGSKGGDGGASGFGGTGGFGGPFAASQARAKLPLLEEEVDTLEAHRDVRKAHVRAAEVSVRLAEVGHDRVARLAATGVVGKEEADKARLEVEAAKAQLEIRVAEMKEFEVKIKYARKRLDDAKAAAFPPAPAPLPVDPPPAAPK